MISNNYVPKACVWELTLKCNMHCRHCGSVAGNARGNELTLSESLHVADQIIDIGCEQITLIGGEVFFCDGWEHIARKLSDAGLDVNIISNGYLIAKEMNPFSYNPILAQIKYAGLSNVGISIDGLQENHNYIRNVHNSYQEALCALYTLKSENIPTAVITSLVDINFGDLEGIYKVLCEFGVTIWQLQIVTPMGNMTNKKDQLIKPSKIPLITKFIREKRFDGKMEIFAGDNIGYFDENELYIRCRPSNLCTWQGCQAGLSVMGIDSVGNVRGCESLNAPEFIEGNLRGELLEDIWNKEGAFAYNRNFDAGMLTGACKACDKGEICHGGCRGACYFTTDNKYENPYCCYPKKASE
jgi:radical SAM protein with 4Fe4S-binding SPASM domain